MAMLFRIVSVIPLFVNGTAISRCICSNDYNVFLLNAQSLYGRHEDLNRCTLVSNFVYPFLF